MITVKYGIEHVSGEQFCFVIWMVKLIHTAITRFFGMIVKSEPTWLRCYVVKIRLRAKRPLDPSYPVELTTLGDHLRKTRLDRGLTQGDVASILQVGTDTVTTWEMNRHQPTAKFAKSIISFLGYIPFEFEAVSLGKLLYYVRLITGNTQRQVANLIGCDTSTLRYFEMNQRKPFARTREKIEDYIDDALARCK